MLSACACGSCCCRQQCEERCVDVREVRVEGGSTHSALRGERRALRPQDTQQRRGVEHTSQAGAHQRGCINSHSSILAQHSAAQHTLTSREEEKATLWKTSMRVQPLSPCSTPDTVDSYQHSYRCAAAASTRTLCVGPKLFSGLCTRWPGSTAACRPVFRLRSPCAIQPALAPPSPAPPRRQGGTVPRPLHHAAALRGGDRAGSTDAVTLLSAYSCAFAVHCAMSPVRCFAVPRCARQLCCRHPALFLLGALYDERVLTHCDALCCLRADPFASPPPLCHRHVVIRGLRSRC